ncbi:MAG: hypothetical protein QN174_01890 [Armatimonadota bacterium]|nr:hypothetical protein [Armatimonadota bacterium]MDR7422238.1 hypothetical protein [Armatimonadota bacterium]MDR7453857.1 hypothetical protein [Armatimonadota bacterium]MDR7457986.1 hypothetical protein [Armatimonadota bacterium]MDR7495698.1 hypothetical protein [Armatimonadota bacterium]
MRRRVRVIAAAGLAFALIGAPALAQPEGPGSGGAPGPGSRVLGDGLIVPGQRIGPARLAMTVEQIIAAVGRPPTRDEFPADGVVLYEWREEGLWVSQVAGTGRIRVISVFGTSDRYRTDRGVVLLTPRARIEAVYGRGFRAYDYPAEGITLLRYHALGLQFGIVNQPSNPTIHGRAFQIGVFRPGDLPPVRRPAP